MTVRAPACPDAVHHEGVLTRSMFTYRANESPVVKVGNYRIGFICLPYRHYCSVGLRANTMNSPILTRNGRSERALGTILSAGVMAAATARLGSFSCLAK